MVKVIIDYDKCEGASCGACIDTCPMAIFNLEGDKIVLENEELCSECEVCFDDCPQDAISIEN